MDKYPDSAINHKLYNVRVIVDAARSKQPKHMDAEVFTNVDESGTNKKTIGVQTNITFEVSGETDESKGKESDENVPVFKGKSVDKKNKPETKVYYDYSGSREGPVFPKIDDDSFRTLNWFHFQPPSSGYWTTAKPRPRTEGWFSFVGREIVVITDFISSPARQFYSLRNRIATQSNTITLPRLLASQAVLL